MHPDLYLGAPLVKPPAVYNAGLLRATGQTITTEAWVWLGDLSGQMLFYPPNVVGLERPRVAGHLDASTAAGISPTRRSPPGERAATHYNGSTETGGAGARDRDRLRRLAGH